MLRDGRDTRHAGDAAVDAEIIEEIPMGNTHRLFMRALPLDSGVGEPYIFEVDVPAHPYEVLGISTKREWRIALTSEHVALVRRGHRRRRA